MRRFPARTALEFDVMKTGEREFQDMLPAAAAEKEAGVTHGIIESTAHGLIVLSPMAGRTGRRVLFVNNYGGREVWEKVKAGLVPPHHLWGCLQLVRMGYEVALAEPVPDFIPRRPLPHDLRLLRVVRSWLRKDDIVYCGHNVLYWIPFLRSIGLARRHIVSLLFALEPLDFSGAHSAIVALTPTAETQARTLAPKTKIAHLGWGVDPASYPRHPYQPRYLLHCGIAGRDFPTLHAASKLTAQPLRLIAHDYAKDLAWPSNVEVVDSGNGYNHEEKKVTFRELVNVHYAGAAASVIITFANPKKDHALGFTNLIEALVMGLPIIQTRTSALADEIDVEKAGCGIAVPPADPQAIAAAMETIMREPERARAMAAASRRLCESHYNIHRFARKLHELFESL